MPPTIGSIKQSNTIRKRVPFYVRFFTTPQPIFVLYHRIRILVLKGSPKYKKSHEIDSKCTFFSTVRVDL